MIVLLSPAKTLDFSEFTVTDYSEPRLLDDAKKLVQILKQKSAEDLKALMNVSDKIATLNVQRYHSFETPFTTENAKPAILAFKGDVYQGLEAATFDADDHVFAQQHLRILSGLYGVLRPMDLMQPYRLEMGTKLKNDAFGSLYEFWNNRITELINQDLEASEGDTIVNLASKEYFKAIKTKELRGNLLHVHFKEQRGDALKVIAFNAKKARGAMAKQIVTYKITEKEQLKDLAVNEYLFCQDLSDASNYVFVKE